jgi:hypothetical protein
MLVNARARKPIVIALDTPVTDHPVSRVMDPRKRAGKHRADRDAAEQAARAQSPSDTENWSFDLLLWASAR